MKYIAGKTKLIAIVFAALIALPQSPLVVAQNQARRLILKDGSYQSVTKYEVHGDRVRYFSAERGEWEEVPNSMIDWDATEKYEQGRQQDKLAPEAVELDKQIDAERKAEQDRSPLVAPGLRLPDEGGIFLLDTYENQPQLVELQQSGGDLDKNTKSSILRSAINPLAGAKQTIQLPGAHAQIQSHTAVPSIYVNLEANTNNNDATRNNGAPATASPTAKPQATPADSDRFRIIRIDIKGGKRVAGSLKVAVTGKTKSDERFVASTVTALTGGWFKLTSTEPLATGEYAIAEMMGKEGINLYVWDFGVNPDAPANPFAWKPETPIAPKSDQPASVQKRDKQ